MRSQRLSILLLPLASAGVLKATIAAVQGALSGAQAVRCLLGPPFKAVSQLVAIQNAYLVKAIFKSEPCATNENAY